MLRAYRDISSTHNAIIVSPYASGSGDWFDRWGSQIAGKVEIYVRDVGTQQDLDRIIERHMARINSQTPQGRTYQGPLVRRHFYCRRSLEYCENQMRYLEVPSNVDFITWSRRAEQICRNLGWPYFHANPEYQQTYYWWRQDPRSCLNLK